MISVSLVSRVTARSLHGVNRHLASGHEISRLQHGLQLIMVALCNRADHYIFAL